MTGSLRVLQLTDTHLYADPAASLLGVNTLESFREVVDSALAHGPYDLVLVTGDLVHDSSRAGYDRLVAEVRRFGVPAYCLAGNHDEAAAFAAYLGRDGVSAPKQVDAGAWRIVLLDSTVPGAEGGHLGEAEFAVLVAALAEGERQVLVCLHHQPVPVHSAWLDTMAVANGSELLAAIEGQPRVRGVLWGHVHQEYDQVHGGVRFMATPSTCVQFAIRNDDFQVDNRPPGFRLLDLHADGRIESRVVRLERVPTGLDIASAGY
ncbi:MAG: 3',5'-cyclic-AMP phosphodiesterase [Gammaproteobacteria bacterium]